MAKKYEIDRAKWSNGTFMEQYVNPPASVLYSSKTDRSCCLGLILEQCGYRQSELAGVCTPEYIVDHWMVPEWMTKKSLYGDWIDSDVVNEMVGINDNRDLEESEREHRLTELAQSVGVDLRFVGDLFPEDGR